MKRLFLMPLLVAFIALGLWGTLWPGAFLYRPISVPPANTSYLYLDQLQSIAPVVGKKVIFPLGLIDYSTQEKLTMYGWRLSGYTGKGHLFTIQDYLDQTRGSVGLNGKYDAAQDAIVFDFPWHRPVTHTGPELVAQIGKLTPTATNSLLSNSAWTLDPWREALDELMSEPDNFFHAWKVRLQECCSSGGEIADAIVWAGISIHIC